MDNLNSFSHGQIVSKLWLCEELEKFCKPKDDLYILGGWHNVLGFMLAVRKPNYYKKIHNIDIDINAILVADKVSNAWTNQLYVDNHVINTCADCNSYNFVINPESDVVINCSVEHFENNNWYNKLPSGTLVCIQSSDILESGGGWIQKQPNKDLDTFLSRFPCKETLYVGTKRIQYPHQGYNRFMLIGRTI